MEFNFSTAGQIIFGIGVIKRLAGLAAQHGKRAFLIHGRTPERWNFCVKALNDAGVAVVTFGINGEPTTEMVSAAANEAKTQDCDLVISIGGGSVIDAGKAVAAMLTNQCELFDYLEIVGGGQSPCTAPAFHIAVPTTAGTGAEVTANSVLSSKLQRVKVSMRGRNMLPAVALIDPMLTVSLPKSITAATGLDAMTQLIEAYVSNKANPMTDALCVEGLRRAARSMLKVYENGEDVDARQDLCLASLFSGIALANAKLGAVHGLAAPIGGLFGTAHGFVCAALLPQVMKANLGALLQRDPQSQAIERYSAIGRILSGNPNADAWDGVEWIEKLASQLNVPGLRSLGIRKEDFPEIVVKAMNASSMKGNPVLLNEAELTEILKRSMD